MATSEINNDGLVRDLNILDKENVMLLARIAEQSE